MPRKSGRAIVAGLFLTFVIPSTYWTLAILIEAGVLTLERGWIAFEIVNSLGLSAIAQIALTFIGIRFVGRGLRLRSIGPWIGISVVGLPVSGVAWFIGFAVFGAAMGSPF